MEVCNWQCTREAIIKLGKALGCGVCNKPLREPCTLGSCDHLFCRSCINGHLGKTCPLCHAPAWVKDLQLKRELASVVSLYNKLCTIIDRDVAPDHGSRADMEDVGRRVVIEITDQTAVDGCGITYNPSGVMNREDVPRKALRPRNVSPRKAVAQKKNVKRTRATSHPGGVPIVKKKCPGSDGGVVVQESDEGDAITATRSSSSENDLMSVYDFVPSPQRPKPAAKKRVRKPSAKTLKRQRVTVANRRWLRDGTPSKLGEESESGFDSERSLKHVSFSVDVSPSQASTQGSCSLESREPSSQGDLGVAVTPNGTQESGYSTGSNLNASGLSEEVQLSSNIRQDTTSKNNGPHRRQTPNQQCGEHKKPTKHLARNSEKVSQAFRDHVEVEPSPLTAPKRIATSRDQDNTASSNQSNNQKPLREPRKRRQEVPLKQQSGGSPSSVTNPPTQEKGALPSPKRRHGRVRVQETSENIIQQSDTRRKKTCAESDQRTENLSPEALQPWPNSRQTRSRVGRASSSPPSNPKTSHRDVSSPGEVARDLEPRSGTPSSSEKCPSSRAGKTTASPRNSSAVTKRNKRGETPLHIATIKGDMDAATKLLQDGADPNAKENAGWTPLHEACNHGHASIVAVLLDHGALINAPGFEHDSPLHDAVINHRLQVVKLLLQRGASLTVRNMHGLTPADCAKSDAMRAALKTKPLVTTATETTIAASQKSLLSRNQPVVLLGTGLSAFQRKQLQCCAKFLGGGRVVDEFGAQVTHLVAACNRDNLCMRTMKYLNAVLSGVWVVSFDWVTKSFQSRKWAAEIDFEVKGATTLPTSSGPAKGRRNADQQLPGLLDGCHFYLFSTFSPPTPSRPEIIQLIKNGGGKILSRQPKPDDDIVQSSTTIPYHVRPGSELATCSCYIVHDHVEGRAPPRVRTGKLCTVPVSWLMDCISQYELLDLPD